MQIKLTVTDDNNIDRTYLSASLTEVSAETGLVQEAPTEARAEAATETLVEIPAELASPTPTETEQVAIEEQKEIAQSEEVAEPVVA